MTKAEKQCIVFLRLENYNRANTILNVCMRGHGSRGILDLKVIEIFHTSYTTHVYLHTLARFGAIAIRLTAPLQTDCCIKKKKKKLLLVKGNGFTVVLQSLIKVMLA